MPLTATEGEGTIFDVIPEGIYPGICTSVFDLGIQYNEKFNIKKHEILLQFELPTQRILVENEDKPRAISKRYTLSLHEKSNLRKDLQTWRGKSFTTKELEGFDILVLLGINCQIQIIHNVKGDKTYANISTILPLTPGTKPLKPENPLRSFSFEDNEEVPEGTPSWIKEIIDAALTAEVPPADGQENPPIDAYSDDIPF